MKNCSNPKWHIGIFPIFDTAKCLNWKKHHTKKKKKNVKPIGLLLSQGAPWGVAPACAPPVDRFPLESHRDRSPPAWVPQMMAYPCCWWKKSGDHQLRFGRPIPWFYQGFINIPGFSARVLWTINGSILVWYILTTCICHKESTVHVDKCVESHGPLGIFSWALWRYEHRKVDVHVLTESQTCWSRPFAAA